MELKKQMLISALLVGALVFGGLGTAAAVNPPDVVTLTANGTYDVKFQSSAIVAVPGGSTETVTETATVTETDTVTNTVVETQTVTESGTVTVTETGTVTQTETVTSGTTSVATETIPVNNPDVTPDFLGLMFVSSAPYTTGHSVSVTLVMDAGAVTRTITLTTTTFSFEGSEAFYVTDYGVIEEVTSVTATSTAFGGFTATIPFAESPDPAGGVYFYINPSVYGYYWQVEL